jgi:hypothetical protein
MYGVAAPRRGGGGGVSVDLNGHLVVVVVLLSLLSYM